jgi:hypothetical protein
MENKRAREKSSAGSKVLQESISRLTAYDEYEIVFKCCKELKNETFYS